MTTQPTGHNGATSVPNTVPGILTALPEKLRAAFRTELATVLDHGDPATVDHVIGAWWAQALWHTDPSIRAAFATLDDATAHLTALPDWPAETRVPLPSVFAVRRELEPFSDLRMFDQEVDATIWHAADTGSLDRLRTALHNWLGIALMAHYAAKHKHLPQEIEQRGELQRELLEQWLREHPEATH